MIVQRGQRGKLDELFDISTPIRVIMHVNGTAVYDYCCFGVDERGKLSDDRYMIFYNQPCSPHNEISYQHIENNAVFIIDLNRLANQIQKLVFTVSIDGNDTMGQITDFSAIIEQDGASPIVLNLKGSDFSQERTIISFEIYRKDVWRFSAVSRGFNGDLSDLLKSFGGEEIDDNQIIAEENNNLQSVVELESSVDRADRTTNSVQDELKISINPPDFSSTNLNEDSSQNETEIVAEKTNVLDNAHNEEADSNYPDKSTIQQETSSISTTPLYVTSANSNTDSLLNGTETTAGMGRIILNNTQNTETESKNPDKSLDQIETAPIDRASAETRNNIRSLISRNKWQILLISIISVSFIIIVAIIGAVSRGTKTDPTQSISETNILHVPAASNYYKGKNYQIAINELQNAGFVIGDPVILEDLTSDSDKPDGYVESVVINNDDFFHKDDSFPLESIVIVTYHVIPKTALPISSSETKNLQPEEIADTFFNSNFMDVKISEKYDLDPASTPNDITPEVRVGGRTSFQKGEEVAFDAPISIVCHYPYEQYKVHVGIDFISNWIFSKYDVNVFLGDEKLITLPHGKDVELDLNLTPAEYQLSFRNTDDGSVSGEVKLNVDSDIDVAYQIYCHSGYVDVKTQHEERSGLLGDDEIKISSARFAFWKTNYQEVVQTLEQFGFTNIVENPIYEDRPSYFADGDTKCVTINGKDDYQPGEVYKKDAEVIVSYYTDSIETPSDTTTTSETVVTEAITPMLSLEDAKAALIVAFTNKFSEDVFTDGDFDPEKFHDIQYSGEFRMEEWKTGTWSMNEEGSWDVKNHYLYMNAHDIAVKVNCNVSFNEMHYYISNVEYVNARKAYIDSNDPNKTSGVNRPKTDASNPFLIISANLVNSSNHDTGEAISMATSTTTTTTTIQKDQELGIDFPRPTGTPVLRKGSVGDDVGWLQTALNKAMKAGLTVNSSFDDKTDTAVREFQSRCGLSADGAVGAKTIEKLVKIISGNEVMPAATVPPTTKAPTQTTTKSNKNSLRESQAKRALEYMGEAYYPYGFECHWWTKCYEHTQSDDGSWYFKVGVTITNEYGASYEAIAEAYVNNTKQCVENFKVYREK